MMILIALILKYLLCIQVLEDHQQKALQQGSEDPQSAEILQKCEEFLPGQVEQTEDIISSIVKSIQAKVKSSLLIIKLKHSGNVWKKVIKQKYPGAVSTGARVKTDKKGKKDGKKNGEQDLSDLDNSD